MLLDNTEEEVLKMMTTLSLNRHLLPTVVMLQLVVPLVVYYSPSSGFVLGFNNNGLHQHQQVVFGGVVRHPLLQNSVRTTAAAAASSASLHHHHRNHHPRHCRHHLFLSSTSKNHHHNLILENNDTTDNGEEPFSSPKSSSSSFCDDSNSMSRRVAVDQIIRGGMTLSSLLLLSSSNPAHAADDDNVNNNNNVSRDNNDDYNDTKKKRILITGSNSGIGLDAAQRMVLRGHEVVLACRTLDKAIAAADKIRTNIANNAEDAVYANSLLKSLKLLPMECNLADLSSIDAFVNNLTTSTNNNNNNNNRAFDAVCYNAGIARNIDAKDVARTKDGFELTVGTNHLGHFYLNHLLLKSNLIRNNNNGNGAGGGGRIVVTSSSVHDPESPGGAQGATATLGNLQGLEYAVSNGSRQFDMVDGGPYNADKAYKDSKLCNILFTRELQRRLDQNKYGSPNNNIKVNCFTPGLIVGTGLFRDQNQVFTKVFDIAATNLLKVGETTHYGGGALEYMTLSTKVGEKSGGLYYYSPPGSSKFGDDAFGKQFDVSNISKEAQESDDNGKATRLWELSEKLVGISPM